MERLASFVIGFFQVAATVFAFALIVFLAWIAWMYIVDVRQREHTIRRNYPVIGRLRYKFEHLGEFFRQYFFAMDREEMPFNRAQRSWAYRAAKNVDTTIAFGSTRSLNQPGEVIFLNCPFPKLDEEVVEPSQISFGEGYARDPYCTAALVNISGMSFGALGVPAVRALSNGAAAAGIWMNTGEGGLSDYHLEGGCDLVFQIGTAKYGVRNEKGELSEKRLLELAAIPQVKMFEIKLSQGAKPGKGGLLPGGKVTPEIARVRGIPVGQDSISPNGHSDIRCVDDLLDRIQCIRELTGKPVGFKCVLGQSSWLSDLFDRILKRGLDSAPDFITLDSADGGTGAAPQPLMDYMGLPLKSSLPVVVDLLLEYGLKERIRVICSGKMIVPSEVAWAFAMGADVVVSARGFMFALGCIQSLQCNKNTCPTGITTHDKDLQRGLDPTNKSVRVANYARNIAQGVGMIAHSCGVDEPRLLNRAHAQIINEAGFPEAMIEAYPHPEVRELKIK